MTKTQATSQVNHTYWKVDQPGLTPVAAMFTRALSLPLVITPVMAPIKAKPVAAIPIQ